MVYGFADAVVTNLNCIACPEPCMACRITGLVAPPYTKPAVL